MLWSSSWVLIRIGLDEEALPPITFAGLRYVLAATVLLGWAARSSRHRRQLAQLDRPALRSLAVLGLVFYAVTQGAQFIAIDLQPAATTSLILSLTPLLVAVLSSRTVGERPAPRQVAGAVIVCGGAWLYFSGDLGSTTLGLTAAGVGLAANAVSSLMGRHVNRVRSLPAVVVTAVSMAIGATVLLAAGVAVEGVPSVSLRAAVLIAWLAVVNTAVAFTLWNESLRDLSAVESAGINNTMLVQIALLAWIFLNEPPGLVGMLGILVVSAGIFMTQAITDRKPAVR